MRRALFTFLSALALTATGVVGAIAVGGSGPVDPPPKIAFLANGIVPADALAAGGIAGQLGAPLFTTRADSLNDDARDGMKAYDPDLVIVLGGPVAINDSVLTALSAATGLPRTDDVNPTSGIARVAGGDRFATARAVADLLAAYDPAYLPVDATALGAVDADKLDGMDSTDFALSDQACGPSEVVTGTAADGTPTCTPSEDGIVVTRGFDRYRSTDDLTIINEFTGTIMTPNGADAFVGAMLDVPFPVGPLPNRELTELEVCGLDGADNIRSTQLLLHDIDTQDNVLVYLDVPVTYVDDTCTTIPLGDVPVIAGPDRRASFWLELIADTTTTANLRATFGPPTAEATPVTTTRTDVAPTRAGTRGGS